MKIGVQTISWGSTIDDIDALCRDVAAIGFAGIEVAQKISSFRNEDLERLPSLLIKNNLQLSGLAGGSLNERIKNKTHLTPDYYYLDEWDSEVITNYRQNEDNPIGFHPHIYKDIDTIAKLEPYLQKSPHIKLILDTAHLTLVGDDVCEVLKRHDRRVIAVHLKDWSAQYGTSPFLIGQGFTTLGDGDLDKWTSSIDGRVRTRTSSENIKDRRQILTKVVSYLVESDFSGWVIIEQDTVHDNNPISSAKRSWDWLQNAIRQASGSI